ncbi:MAG: hypothetical protein methR_P3439 [Methyloprofundus sp.]|nr:MAG: hypothetical protein methR_P3439 [Methyloprofundus sp.]
MDKQQVQLEIVAAKNLINTLNALVTEVTMLQPLQEMLQAINIAVDELLTAITEYQDSTLADYIQESDALVYLDEVVDLDPISELEVQFFGVLENMTENELTVFLMQMLDKIELAYTQLIEKLHVINALFEE